MTPAMRTRLQAASDYVLDQLGNQADAADIIAGLVEHHGAKFNDRRDPYSIRCAGVTTTCTHDRGAFLLRQWSGRAVLKLVMASQDDRA